MHFAEHAKLKVENLMVPSRFLSVVRSQLGGKPLIAHVATGVRGEENSPPAERCDHRLPARSPDTATRSRCRVSRTPDGQPSRLRSRQPGVPHSK